MNTKTLLKQLGIVVISSVLVACAGTPEALEGGGDSGQDRGRDCILQSTIRDYQVLDDRNLIVTAAAKRKYHVELFRRAYGLRTDWQIGFRSPTGRLCAGSGEVITSDSFDRKEAVGVKSVTEVDADELDELLVRYGKKEPEFQEPPPEKPVEGAEVEELD